MRSGGGISDNKPAITDHEPCGPTDVANAKEAEFTDFLKRACEALNVNLEANWNACLVGSGAASAAMPDGPGSSGTAPDGIANAAAGLTALSHAPASVNVQQLAIKVYRTSNGLVNGSNSASGRASAVASALNSGLVRLDALSGRPQTASAAARAASAIKPCRSYSMGGGFASYMLQRRRSSSTGGGACS